jgi:hypothetical protein
MPEALTPPYEKHAGSDDEKAFSDYIGHMLPRVESWTPGTAIASDATRHPTFTKAQIADAEVHLGETPLILICAQRPDASRARRSRPPMPPNTWRFPTRRTLSTDDSDHEYLGWLRDFHNKSTEILDALSMVPQEIANVSRDRDGSPLSQSHLTSTRARLELRLCPLRKNVQANSHDCSGCKGAERSAYPSLGS